MTDPATLTALLPLLATAFGAGAVTQLARLLARPAPPPVRRVFALAVAAGIAALTAVALLSVTVPLRSGPAPALLLAAACVVGWSGPSLLTRLGGLIERRLGLGGQDG